MGEIRLHIGPYKTASTTVQNILADRRDDLARHGVLYPSTPDGATSHFEALCDFLNQTVTQLPPTQRFLSAYLAYRPRRRRGLWQRLCDEARAHPGPVVISAEQLCGLPAATARQLVDALPSDDVRVVMVSRQPSGAVASWYQELAKREPVTDFQDFTARVFADLADPAPSDVGFLNPSRTRRAWMEAGVAVHEVDAFAGLTGQNVQETLTWLAPEVEWPIPQMHANSSMSAFGLRAWREHTARQPPTFAGAGLEVWSRMHRTFPETALGPRLALSQEASARIDAFCAGTAPHLVLPDDSVEGSAVPEVPRHMLDRMRRWQRIADARWRLYDTASVMSGRGALFRGVWLD